LRSLIPGARGAKKIDTMLDITLVCAVIVTAFALFASERMRVDLVAMLILATLVVIGQLRSGFLSVEEAFSGFSNEATLTIGAMFILSTGLTKTGAIGFISRKLTAVGDRSQTKLFVVMIAIAGVVSAFINNTAAVAIFLPIALGLAITTRSRPTLRGGR
jgi:di/tricarboxylate transporter